MASAWNGSWPVTNLEQHHPKAVEIRAAVWLGLALALLW